MLASEWTLLHAHVMHTVAPAYVLATARDGNERDLDEQSDLAVVLNALAEHSDEIVAEWLKR